MADLTIDGIFRDPKTKHDLKLFTPESIQWLEKKLFEKNGKPYIKCLGSDRDRPAKPEEIVRQLWIKRLLDDYHYRKERIEVEYAVWFGSGISDKSADIVVMHADGESPYIIFETKKPKRKDGIQQLRSYCNAEGSPIGVWSNGEELVILHREEPNVFTQISSIPTIEQTLQDVISEQWTLEKLDDVDKLKRERLSLKKVILDLEDLVLANAGVDAFEEVFKLLYAKLYDEWAAINLPQREGKLQFRLYGESPDNIYKKISGLFAQARKQWPDVFSPADKIELTPPHLVTCVSFLQDLRLFNANLQIIDEAFEYLVTQVAKGSKGQYFTPRWVIDMCIKMLNPKPGEFVIDPAAGSCGFLVHTIMWIAKGKITADGLPQHAREFAQNNIWAIDFDGKAIKISKAMNLIAGDGKGHVYKANSLDSRNWNAATKSVFERFRDDEGDDHFKSLNFDVLFTNPPFAGQIRERQILRQYQLAERDGRMVARIGRDILFIERCLQMIRPGGRMAIILPQGRLNNTKDLHIREFLFEKARLLGVVGLHINTFKPHTGTKTSVLFLRKHTAKELEEIRSTRNKHLKEWDDLLEELRELGELDEPIDDRLPPSVLAYLESEFDAQSIDELNEEGPVESSVAEQNDDDLVELIKELEDRLEKKPGRFKGRTNIIREINDLKRNLASRTRSGQLNWLLENELLLKNYQSIWLTEKTASDLDYPIFFGVSENGGKDNSGNPIYKKDANSELQVDDHGHLIVEHDLDDVADAFIAFAKKQDFDFWAE